MIPLPPGHMLCRPANVGPKCENCRRWVDHPEQTPGSIARVVNPTSQRDPACIHMPAYYVKESK